MIDGKGPINTSSTAPIEKTWWVAPTASTFAGNALNTVLFFSIAFHASSDPFMAENWPHIALVDYLFKLAICTLMFVPAYRVLR